MKGGDKMDKMDLILQELQGVKENQHHHEEMISQLMQMVGVTNAKVSGLQKDVEVLREDVTMLKEDVAVLKEDVSVLKQITERIEKRQKKQDQIIDTLSVRSVEQETEIRELEKAVS